MHFNKGHNRRLDAEQRRGWFPAARPGFVRNRQLPLEALLVVRRITGVVKEKRKHLRSEKSHGKFIQ